MTEIDEASAIRLDWLLAIHDTYQKVQNEAAPTQPQPGSTVTRPLPPPGG